MRASHQYVPVAIAFTEEIEQRVGVDFRSPDHDWVNLACRRGVEIKSIVEWDLVIGYRALSERPLHSRIAFWAPEVAHTDLRLVTLPRRCWFLVEYKVDDSHDAAKVRGVDLVAVKPDPVFFFDMKY